MAQTLIDILKQAGFKGEGLKMAYAIVMAESSGNARAHNGNAGTGDNSYGLFQINMLGAMGPERRARYGLSSNDDLYDPLTNAKIAYAMSNGGKNWSAWSTFGSGAYKDYYGGSMGATVSSSGNASLAASLGATVTPQLDKYELAEKYGLTWATIKANKEISDLFSQAVKGGWDADLFTAKLKNTKWWRTTSDSVRKYFMLKTGDPATWSAKYAENAYKLNQIAVDVGLGNQIIKSGQYSSILNRAIGYAMRDGWSDARIKAYFGQYVGMHDGGMWGEAGEAYDQLFQLAYANGQQFSQSWYTNNIRQVLSGKTTLQALETYTRNQAAAKYSAFADQIRAGHNAMDLAQPYISAVAEILELPSTDIDLNNKWVSKAMSAKQTGPLAGTQYPLWQFQNDLRDDPLWKQTNNARESMFSIARQVARDFGFSY
jgi:lysozyme-like protein